FVRPVVVAELSWTGAAEAGAARTPARTAARPRDVARGCTNLNASSSRVASSTAKTGPRARLKMLNNLRFALFHVRRILRNLELCSAKGNPAVGSEGWRGWDGRCVFGPRTTRGTPSTLRRTESCYDRTVPKQPRFRRLALAAAIAFSAACGRKSAAV